MIPAKAWTSQSKTDLSPLSPSKISDQYKAWTKKVLFILRIEFAVCFIAIVAVPCSLIRALIIRSTSDSLKVRQTGAVFPVAESTNWEPHFVSGQDIAEDTPSCILAKPISGWRRIWCPWWRIPWKTTQGTWAQDVPDKVASIKLLACTKAPLVATKWDARMYFDFLVCWDRISPYNRGCPGLTL